MSVNYTTVVVAKPKRRQPSQKEPARRNDGSSVTYTTIMHVLPTPEKRAAPEVEVVADTAAPQKASRPEAEVSADAATPQKASRPEADVSADAATPQRNEPVDEQDPTATYRVVRDLPKVDLKKGDEIACTKYKEEEYFMKGRVMGTGQACHLPADLAERRSHSKYVFVMRSDYKAMDIRQGDILTPADGWLMGTVLRTAKRGTFPDNYVERDSSRKGAYRALYDFDVTDEDDVSFKDGDLIISDVIFGTVKRTGEVCALPMNILGKDGPRDNIESDTSAERGKTEADGDDSSTLLQRAVRIYPSVISKTLVIVGDIACGKTCLLCAITGMPFPEVYMSTVSDIYYTYVVAIGRQVDFTLRDTGGQEDYDRLRPLYYPQAEVYLICYAIDSPDSLSNIKKKWVPEVRHHSPNIPIILVGTKSELRDNDDILSKSQQLVRKEDVSLLAKEVGAYEYLECSSKTKVGVLAVFEAAARAALLVEKQNKNKCSLQ